MLSDIFKVLLHGVAQVIYKKFIIKSKPRAKESVKKVCSISPVKLHRTYFLHLLKYTLNQKQWQVFQA